MVRLRKSMTYPMAVKELTTSKEKTETGEGRRALIHPGQFHFLHIYIEQCTCIRHG